MGTQDKDRDMLLVVWMSYLVVPPWVGLVRMLNVVVASSVSFVVVEVGFVVNRQCINQVVKNNQSLGVGFTLEAITDTLTLWSLNIAGGQRLTGGLSASLNHHTVTLHPHLGSRYGDLPRHSRNGRY